MGDEDLESSLETMRAARTVVRCVNYLELTLELVMRMHNVDERDLALKRCVDIIREITTIDRVTLHESIDIQEKVGASLAVHALLAVAVAKRTMRRVDIVGECWLTTNEAAERNISRLHRSMLALEKDLTKLPDLQTEGIETWGPNWLWPTPGSLEDLRTRLSELSKAIVKYERVLVGKSIKTVTVACSNEQTVFLELLRRIGRVANWDSGDGCFADGPQPLTIMWEGWLEQSFDVKGWEHFAPAVFWEVVNNLRNMGIPFDADCCNIGLVFDDCCFKQPRRRHDIDSLEPAKEPPTDIAVIPPGATFQTLNDKNGPTIAASIRDGFETSLDCFLEIYADQIRMMMDLVATRLTPDRRWLRVDLTRFRQFAAANECMPTEGYYPDEFLKNDPFQAAIDLEGLTGVKLAKHGDPIWLLMQHKRFKEATATHGEQSTFSDYLQRNHPERLFDPDDPNGWGRTATEQLKYEPLLTETEREAYLAELAPDVAEKSRHASNVRESKLTTNDRLVLLYTNTPEASDWTAPIIAQLWGVDESTIRKCAMWKANQKVLKAQKREHVKRRET
ncbi:hypothetical protein [Novipirellula sp.]|uniref:hypothetical protein n=1 Tax=Novipirellula sp. TaxID=2795430 RepID=UPI00356A7A18